MPGHVVPKKLYVLVFAALIVFTGPPQVSRSLTSANGTPSRRW